MVFTALEFWLGVSLAFFIGVTAVACVAMAMTNQERIAETKQLHALWHDLLKNMQRRDT